MPNFAYTNTTQFRPFSFEEQLRPLLMYTQAHQAVEEAYGELDSQANAIGSLANEINDPVAYGRYKAYESSLREQADTLAKNGLTPGSRQALLDLKGKYAKDITPIQNAITRRRELADEQRKALLQNPTLMFQRDMNSMSYDSSLDRFLENPDYDYGERYSGALLTQQVSQAAGNLAKELSNYGNGKRLDDYTKTWLQQHGFTREQVLDAISNPDRANSQPVLNAIVEQVIGSSGISGWADEPTRDKAYDYARQGLWSAIGQTNVSPYEDYASKAALANYYRGRGTEKPSSNFALNPTPVFSSREKSKAEREFLDNTKKYKDYFTTDANGKTVLTKKGWEEYNRRVENMTGKSMITPEGTNILTEVGTVYSDSPFKTFLDSLGMKGMSNEGYGAWQAETAGSLWDKYIDNSPAARTAEYDAMRTMEYIYDVSQSPEYQRNYKAKLSRAIGSDEKFNEVDYNPKTNKWEETGETLSFADFDTDDYTLASRAPSELGSTLFIKKKGEKAKRYKAPPGINTTAEGGRDQVFSEMLMTQRLLQNPNLSPTQREKLEKHYDNLTQQQAMFESQLDLTNRTKDQEFLPYYIP